MKFWCFACQEWFKDPKHFSDCPRLSEVDKPQPKEQNTTVTPFLTGCTCGGPYRVSDQEQV